MAVTTTSRINKTFSKILSDNSAIAFERGSTFCWSSSKGVITHKPIKTKQNLWQLLHELAHAKLKHYDYASDVGLIRMEAEAWNHARHKLAPKYSVVIDYGFIEDSLDTYRQWLHERSLCPQCKQTGIQKNENTYNCFNCRCLWQVNESRLCGLRRKVI
jgi:hypothetical protein